jgi:maltooligosyltrehalose trehalohydrolase
VLTTGERDGYYSDYADRPLDHLGRCLVNGFAYQGEVSRYRKGETRGEPAAGLPPAAFVSFLQNHDQIGNRAFGERIARIADHRAVRAAAAILLLSPSPPLVFMGEEFGAETPFLFFCDFERDLAATVTAGRRNEFARFARFSEPAERERIPDPNAATTFEESRLDWSVVTQPPHREWLCLYRQLMKLRRQHIAPRVSKACTVKADYEVCGSRALSTRWEFPDRSKLTLLANLGTASLSGLTSPSAEIIYVSPQVTLEALNSGTLPAWSVVWFLES